MILVVVLVFLGVFAASAALMFAFGKSSSRQTRKVQAVLNSALATDVQRAAEGNLNFRKDETLSAVPWLNRGLLKLDIAERLRSINFKVEFGSRPHVDLGSLDSEF